MKCWSKNREYLYFFFTFFCKKILYWVFLSNT